MENVFLIHSAKGTTWKKHKYLRIENGRYIYPKNKKETDTKGSIEDKLRRKQTDKKDLIISKSKTIVPNKTEVRTREGSGYDLKNERVGNLTKSTVTYDSDKAAIQRLQAEKNAKKAKKAAGAAQKKSYTDQINRMKTADTMKSLSQFISEQKKVGKKTPTKSSTKRTTTKKTTGLTNPLTGVSTASTKKPRLNNYKIKPGSGQKGVSTPSREPIGTLSNISKSKRKTQIKTSSSNLSTKATSNNATRGTSSNASRATSSNASRTSSRGTPSNAVKKKKKKR